MPTPTPDAVIFEKSKKQGDTKYARVDSTLTIAERILGLDRSKGQTGHIRVQPYGVEFITGDPLDTLNYPSGHPKEGQGARYNWTRSPDDPTVLLGYLKDKSHEPALTPIEDGQPASNDVVITPATLEGNGTMKGAE